jgi:hypothetical protein
VDADHSDKDVRMSPNIVPARRRERRLTDEEQRAVAEAIATGKVTKVAEHPDAGGDQLRPLPRRQPGPTLGRVRRMA